LKLQEASDTIETSKTSLLAAEAEISKLKSDYTETAERLNEIKCQRVDMEQVIESIRSVMKQESIEHRQVLTQELTALVDSKSMLEQIESLKTVCMFLKYHFHIDTVHHFRC
jgi:flagellar biosynthesis chaperone FliJ